MVFIDRNVLTGFCREVFLAIGLSETEATDSAEILVDADARGIASHGVSRLKRYVNGVRKGVMISGVQPTVLRDTPISLVMDANGAMGLSLSRTTMNTVIKRASEHGVCFASVRNSNHFGIAGLYAEMAARNRAIPKLANDVSFGSMILLVAAVCVTLYVCLGYLRVQANIVVTNKAITKLETELSDLRTRNEAAYNMVVDAVDFEEVYRTAVTELGMVFPNKNKVVTYSVDPSGYVRQFKEIPRADLVNAIKELLPFE